MYTVAKVIRFDINTTSNPLRQFGVGCPVKWEDVILEMEPALKKDPADAKIYLSQDGFSEPGPNRATLTDSNEQKVSTPIELVPRDSKIPEQLSSRAGVKDIKAEKAYYHTDKAGKFYHKWHLSYTGTF